MKSQDSQKTSRKRLFICCDGTSQDATAQDVVKPNDTTITNVRKFQWCLSQTANNETPQITYYHHGPKDRVTGNDTLDVIKDCYNYICDNYRFDGDEIHLIGFSRGAFAVRALACFIGDIGILPRTHFEEYHALFQLWRDSKEKPEEYANLLRDRLRELEDKGRLRRNISIESCAVWDTVRAFKKAELGMGKGQKLHPHVKETEALEWIGSEVPQNLKNAIQALALNEERVDFEPILWKPNESCKTNVRQCWFRGDHSDVGGGYSDSGLANLSLLWLIGQFKDLLRNVSFDDSTVIDFMTPKSTIDIPGKSHKYHSHVSQEGDLHRTTGVQSVALETQRFAREPFLRATPRTTLSSTTIHSTVRIIELADGKANDALVDYKGTDEERKKRWRGWWYDGNHHRSLREDIATNWERTNFEGWLEKEHMRRQKHRNNDKGEYGGERKHEPEDATYKGLAARLYQFRSEMAKPKAFFEPEMGRKSHRTSRPTEDPRSSGPSPRGSDEIHVSPIFSSSSSGDYRPRGRKGLAARKK